MITPLCSGRHARLGSLAPFQVKTGRTVCLLCNCLIEKIFRKANLDRSVFGCQVEWGPFKTGFLKHHGRNPIERRMDQANNKRESGGCCPRPGELIRIEDEGKKGPRFIADLCETVSWGVSVTAGSLPGTPSRRLEFPVETVDDFPYNPP